MADTDPDALSDEACQELACQMEVMRRLFPAGTLLTLIASFPASDGDGHKFLSFGEHRNEAIVEMAEGLLEEGHHSTHRRLNG